MRFDFWQSEQNIPFGGLNFSYLYFFSQLCWKLHFNNFGFGSLDWSFSGSASSCSVDISAVSSLCCWPENAEHYGTMTNWSTLIKKLMQTYIVKVSGSILNISTVHLNGIWRLIWRYLLKPVLGGHPVLSGHYSIPQGCLLNTGFTVIYYCTVIIKCVTKFVCSISIKCHSNEQWRC